MKIFFILISVLFLFADLSGTLSAAQRPLADCADYTDPKDSKKFSHCEGSVKPSSDKWQGYLEFMGKPGTARSLGQTDMFVPLMQDKNDMLFLNLRGQLDFDSDNSEYNIGLGYRHMFDKWILGGYGYFDKRFSETGNEFNQMTFGLEALSETWDFRANGYIPEDKTESVTTLNFDSATVVRRPQDQIKALLRSTVSSFEEKALPGLDFEAGRKISIFEDTRLYLGGYHFIGGDKFDSVSGPRVRLETRIHDLPLLGNGSRLMLGLETQYDKPRGSQTFGMVSLRIPFGVFSAKKRSPLRGLDKRMMEPVVRDVDVVVASKTTSFKKEELAPLFNRNDYEITKAVDIEKISDDTDANLQEKVITALQYDGAGVVFVKGKDGETETIMDWNNLVVDGNQILSSAGKELVMTYKSKNFGTGTIGYTLDGTPVGSKGCVTMKPFSQLNGWTVDATGCRKGVLINQAGNYYITNSTIKNAGGLGISVENGAKFFADKIIIDSSNSSSVRASGADTAVDIRNSIIRNSGGLQALSGATMNLDNVDVIGSSGFGVAANGEDTKLTIRNSTIADGKNTGLQIDLGAMGSVVNTDIINNARAGVNNFGGTLKITDSRILNNGITTDPNGEDLFYSGLVSSGWTKNDEIYFANTILDNVQVTGNGGEAIENQNNSTITIINSPNIKKD